MSLASSRRRDDHWFNMPGPPDQTFASLHPMQFSAKSRTQNKVDTLLSTPWFGETASDADEWRAALAERRAVRASRPSAAPTLIKAIEPRVAMTQNPLQPPPQRVRIAELPKASPPPGIRVPWWMVAVFSSGMLLVSAVLMGSLTVSASLLVLFLL